jgi:ligand-binding sensor domain-containing protein
LGGSNHGLYRFDGQGFRCVLCSEYVGRINQALNGRLMLITSGGFVEYDGKEIIRHTGFGTQFGVHDNQIFDVFQDSDGKMWFCTFKGIRSIAEHRVSTLDPYQPAHTAAYRIHVGGNGALWVATGIGVYRITGRQMWTPQPNLHARSFYACKDGDLWVGTNGSGLVHFHPRLVTMYTTADGLQSDIAMAVLPAHDGRPWVGTNCGLAVFDGTRFRTYAEKDGLANSCVWALAEDQQRNIWIGTYGSSNEGWGSRGALGCDSRRGHP